MEETKQRIQEWVEAYLTDLRTAEPLSIRVRYGLGHHYRDWLDDRVDRQTG